jgi:Arylsulfotransferase (ASST)
MKSKHVVILIIGFLSAIIILSSGLFLNQPLIIQQTEAQGITLPYTVATYGSAWDGLLAFGVNNYLVVMNANGTLVSVRSEPSGTYGVVKNIAQDTLLFQGEPNIGGAASAPSFATHIWNVASNTVQDFLNVTGHHDIEYNPINNTFLTLQNYVKTVGNNSILFDKIVQLDSYGNVLWSWDTYDHIPLSQADPFNLTSAVNGQPVIDFTHANALDWDYNNGIIYLNARHTNTFYKINQTTGDMIWACGQFGNFALLGPNGTPVPSLWYHSHDLKQIAPDVFTMFNNDFDNITNYNDSSSQLMEVTLNEQNMTASVTWSWTAPPQYYSTFLGAADILPNGDWIGDFGSPTHQFVENQPWNFADTGAVLIEVNPVSGQIVRTITFPPGWLIYRIEPLTKLSPNAFLFTPSPTPSPQTPSPSPQTPTPTQSPKSTLAPSPSRTPTPTIDVTQTPSNPSPTLNANYPLITDAAILIVIVIVLILVIIVWLKKKKVKKASE